MSLPALLESLLVWGLYPLWLLAGAGDYLCHRRTDIEHTSGSGESWLHLLQFVCLLIAFASAVLLRINALVLAAVVLLVLTHSVLAHIDVSFTDGQRYISPIEQHIHGFMNVLPLVAAALLGVLHWDEIRSGWHAPWLSVASPIDTGRALLVASFAVLAGVPIVEELVRTRRHDPERRRRYQAGLATIK
jgi:hypothetical protein